MDEVEVVEEGQRPQRLDRERAENLGAFAAHRTDQVAPLDELEGESRAAGVGRDVELVHLHQTRMTEAGERRELAAEGILMPRGLGAGELLERQIESGPLPVLGEPDPSCASFAEELLQDEPAVAGIAYGRHRGILPALTLRKEVFSFDVSRKRDDGYPGD